jgi:hypothetical protein
MGEIPLPHGFRSLQSVTFQETTIDDDLNMGGCGYVNAVDGYTFPAESTYSSVEYLKDDLRLPISTCFNLTQAQTDNMSFMDLYGKCDVIQSRLFEGLEACSFFTQDQMNYVNQTVLATLVLPLANPELSREMYVSKQLRVPLELMEDIVNNEADPSAPKFVTYSTHDWTVATMLEFFQATNGNFTNVPFAS